MKSVSIDIMSLLDTNAFGTTGTDLFAMAWNEDVDAQVLVMDGGNIDVPLKELNENPMFQILVRGNRGADMNTAYTLIRSIHEFLIVQVRQIIDLTEYVEYEPIGGINALGRDENDRTVFSSNYYTFRESL